MPIAQVNGIELYYELQGQGPPVLLIAGLNADHLIWTLQLSVLAREFQCILFDNRGVGQSSQPVGPYSTRQLANDAAALLNHLGLERAHIVGHSMGGAIAQEFAIHHPEMTASLALIASFARLDERALRGLAVWKQCFQRLTPADYREYVFQQCLTYRFYAIPGAVEMLKIQSLANPYPQSLAGFLGQAAACESHDTLERLQRITAPTLVWAPAEDHLIPPRFARAIAERIPGATYYEQPDAGHLCNIEQTETTTERLLEWLRQVR